MPEVEFISVWGHSCIRKEVNTYEVKKSKSRHLQSLMPFVVHENWSSFSLQPGGVLNPQLVTDIWIFLQFPDLFFFNQLSFFTTRYSFATSSLRVTLMNSPEKDLKYDGGISRLILFDIFKYPWDVWPCSVLLSFLCWVSNSFVLATSSFRVKPPGESLALKGHWWRGLKNNNIRHPYHKF